MHRTLNIVAAASACLILTACGAAGTSAGNPSSTGALQATVPTDLVVSSVTSSTSTSANVGVTKALGDAAGGDFLAKRTALQSLITATGECAFTPQIPDPTPPSCYGPRIRYCNHADFTGAQDEACVDADAIGMNDTDGDGALPVGDTGLWSEYAEGGTSGTACAAAQMNYLVDRVAARIDNATSLFATVVCAGRKAGLTPPTVGATSDLTAAVLANATTIGLTPTSVTLARLADSADGRPIYRMTAEAMLNVGNQDRTLRVVLTHSPRDDDNATYRGNLRVAVSNATETHGTNCGSLSGGSTGTVTAGIITYEKSASTVLRYEVNHAEFCGSTTDPFAAADTLDATNVASASNPTGWANNWNFGRFAWNPEAGIGAAAYAWQAGAQDGYARVLNVTVESAADGGATGTAYFGFGPDVDSTSGLGTITGFFCNWAGPNNKLGNNGMSGPSSLAQRQGLVRAAGGTVFASDSSQLAIRYAPANSCDATGNNFSYRAVDAQESSTLTLDNNNLTAATVTHQLIPLTSVSFTLPDAPTGL